MNETLKLVLSKAQSGNGTFIDVNNVANIGLYKKRNGDCYINAWEGVERTKKFILKIAKSDYMLVAQLIFDYDTNTEETKSVFDEPAQTGWGSEPNKQEETNELRNDSEETGALFGR